MKKIIFTLLILVIPFCKAANDGGAPNLPQLQLNVQQIADIPAGLDPFSLTHLTHDELIARIEQLENEEKVAQAAYQAVIQEGGRSSI